MAACGNKLRLLPPRFLKRSRKGKRFLTHTTTSLSLSISLHLPPCRVTSETDILYDIYIINTVETTNRNKKRMEGSLLYGLTVVYAVATVTMVVVRGNSEGDALYALRKSVSDPDHVLASWDQNLVNPCTWFHVTCNPDNHVSRLDLGNSNLSGHLVSDLGKLEHLQYLELYKNNFQGAIPAELGNLKSLISLDLYNNNITGTIPSSLGKLKNLVFLRLNDNQLTGKIPKELVSASSLKVVDVSSNNLCGTIPTSGPFEHIPLNNFENNPRLEGPELMGLAAYDTNCS